LDIVTDQHQIEEIKSA